MFVFSLFTSNIARIYNNKLKLPTFCFFLSPPYFIHDASCAMLDIDCMPLETPMYGNLVKGNRAIFHSSDVKSSHACTEKVPGSTFMGGIVRSITFLQILEMGN